MHITHGGLDVGVAHSLLHRIDVASLLIELGSEVMTQIVVAEFLDASARAGPTPLSLKT